MTATTIDDRDGSAQQLAMRLSLVVGMLMLAGKWLAFALTGSAAILSDAAESVVHVAAVAFAAFSLWLSRQPPDRSHLYGHDKIAYFSAGFEGGMIILAGAYIIYESIRRWVAGADLAHESVGTALVAVAATINGILGYYLVAIGKRQQSIVLIANGRHVLADCITSVGVVAGLLLVRFTGWKTIDPIVAIAVAVHILGSGFGLARQALRGLMDAGDPEIDQVLRRVLDGWVTDSGGRYHGLRHRTTGSIVWVEVHLLQPGRIDLITAHAAATALEDQIEHELLPHRAKVTTHLEPLELHSKHHPHPGSEHDVIDQ